MIQYEVFKINYAIRISCNEWKQLRNVGRTREPCKLAKEIDEEMLVKQMPLTKEIGKNEHE